MVLLALGPPLFRSQHFDELRQQVAFFLPNEHEIIFRPLPMAVAFSERPPRGSKYRHAGRARARSLQRDLKLTNCAPNSCVVFPYKDAWMRKTQNGGSRGSICYAMFKNLDDALSAGVGWAWRKDRESR